MAFLSKVGNILRQTTSRQINAQVSASRPSIYQAIRCMSSSKLFIGGISYSTDEQSLREAFTKYGEVIEARVIMDRETGRSRGFGFVTYTSTEEASSAIQALDGQDLHGRRIRVNYATDRARGYGGGAGGYGGGAGGYGGGAGGYGGGAGGYGGGAGGYGSGAGGYRGGNTYGGDSGGDNYVQGGTGGGYGGDNQIGEGSQFGSSTQFGGEFGGNSQFGGSSGQFSGELGGENNVFGGGSNQLGSMENGGNMDDEPVGGDWKKDDSEDNDDDDLAKRA